MFRWYVAALLFLAWNVAQLHGYRSSQPVYRYVAFAISSELVCVNTEQHAYENFYD